MDVLADLLDGPHARSAFVLRATMAPPWAMRIEDEAPLTVVAVVRGGVWLAPDHEPPTLLAPGDVLVARGTAPYLLADDPATPPDTLVRADGQCVNLAGEPVDATMSQGVRSWGNSPDGRDVMAIGTYGAVGRRLLDVLPERIVVRGTEAGAPFAALLEAELARDAPGQTAVLDRLLDLVLIATLRAWFARPQAPVPAWLRAHDDPQVGRALRLLDHNLAARWTVAGLAAEVGLSRAALAKRFTELVGEPPMTYLARRRAEVGADRLAEPSATVTAVAAELGFATPFAFSAAFKRFHGVSPRKHRQRRRAATAA